MHFSKLPQLRKLRAALHPLVVEQNKNYELSGVARKAKNQRNRNGKRKCDPEESVIEQLHRIQKRKLAELEEEYINQVRNGMELLNKQLELLNIQGAVVPRVPDGVAICDAAPSAVGNLLMVQDGSDGGNAACKSAVDGARCSSMIVPHKAAIPQPILLKPISCYICNKPYLQLHCFYHQLCPDCATFN